MIVLAVASNVVLFVFTCFVLLTEELPRETPYVVLTLLLLLVPILNSVVLSRTRMTTEQRSTRDERSSRRPIAGRMAVFFNVFLLAYSCWAIATQYPHPKEEGTPAAVSLWVFTALVIFTPVVSVVALLGTMKRRKREERGPFVQAR